MCRTCNAVDISHIQILDAEAKLQRAVKTGDAEVVQKLIGDDVDINVKTEVCMCSLCLIDS